MTYDFDLVLDRQGRDVLAANICPVKDAVLREGFDPIPMWVADMSFATAPEILAAMRERLDFPNLGYYTLPEAWYQSILRWQSRRNGVQGLESDHIGYENGVLGGVSSAVQLLSSPGEGVLLHSPTYVGFTHVLENLGRRAVHSPLKRDGNGVWRMDFEDMEQRLRSEQIHLAILCSPHNPTGRVWERRELEAAMELFRRYDVTVISDEIWSDILLPGQRHIPTQSISEDARQRTLAFYAPSKSFSLAGLVGSYHIIYNKTLRERLRKLSSLSHYNSGSVLSVYALIAAYDKGEDWLGQMNAYVAENAALACDFFEHVPGLSLMRPQGTYMLFVDASGWCEAHSESLPQLLRRGAEAGVWWQNGEDFFLANSIRLNLALPRERLREALRRLDTYVFR